MAERRPFFPGRNNIPPPRGIRERGGTRFGISAPPRGIIAAPDRPTTPTQPRPGVPEQRPEKPNHTGRKIALAGTGLLGLGGVAVWTAYETIPAFHQMVDQAFLSHLRGDQLVSTDTKPDAIFDNEADKGGVGKNTLTDRSLSEIKNGLQNVPDQNKTTIAMTWPIDFEEGKTIKYERPKSPWQVTEELRAQVEKGIRPEIIFELNKDDVFKAPAFIYNGELPTEYRGMIMQNSPSFGDKDTTRTQMGRLFLYYKGSDIRPETTIVVWFFSEGLSEENKNLIPLIPMRANEQWNGEGWKNFPTIEPNTGMAQATKDNQVIKLEFEAFPGQNVGTIPELVDKTAFLITPNFRPDENGTITNLQP